MGEEFIVESGYDGYVFLGWAKGQFEAENGEKRSYFNMYVLSPVSTYQSEDYEASGYKAEKKKCLSEEVWKDLSQVEGAGQVTVTLTVKSGMERVLASDRTTSVTDRGSSVEEETVLTGSGGSQEAVLLSRRYPTFQGALVVCQGGDDPAIRLLMTQAVSALTGLGADRVTVCKGAG